MLSLSSLPNGFALALEFLVFCNALWMIATDRERKTKYAVGALVVLLLLRLGLGNFDAGEHFAHHGLDFVNLALLLLGFGLLAEHFRDSGLTNWVSQRLPAGTKGMWLHLSFVFGGSAFLDNIASAMLGAQMTRVIWGRVHPGYLVAIVLAANAGGAWSVLGDTTTTMLWIAGLPWYRALPALSGSLVCWLIVSAYAVKQQQRFIESGGSGAAVQASVERLPVDIGHLVIVVLILVGAITTNVLYELPFVGVWAAILVGNFFRRSSWHELLEVARETSFLIALVVAASLLHVEVLPGASVGTVFLSGVLSAGFDNIPLTKVMIEQGGYDWALVAYSVGIGGSMMWFGSSAGVTVCKDHKELQDWKLWLRSGWYVPIGFVAGFVVQWLLIGWNPLPIKH
jgi:Na+/H+ antiporter NhaD/arsenite permease-like protein